MSGKTISTSETRLEALQIQSSAYGVVIPLLWGVCRVAGNMLWYGGFKAVPHTTSQGGKGGVKVQNTTYTYLASVMMGLCHGRIAGIPRIWRGKAAYSGGITGANLVQATESYTPPGSGAMTYTTAHAATFAQMNLVFGAVDYGDGSYVTTLQLGTDYTVAAGVLTFYRDAYRGVSLSIVYQYTTGSISQTALQQLGLTFIAGEIGQAAWSGLSGFGSQSIGYSGLAAVAGTDYDLGTGAQVENHNFELVGPLAYHLGSSVPDVDPSLVLRDLLSSARAGANYPGDKLDAWAQWSDYCVASGLLVSPALDTQARAADLVQTVADMTNTLVVPHNGRLRMVPLSDAAATGNGRTYTPSVAPVYALDDTCYTPSAGQAPVRMRRKSPADRFNHVRVQYRDRSNNYNPAIAEAKDQADIDTFGLRSMPIIDASAWICDAAAARQVAQLRMQRSLNVAADYETSLPWHYALLECGDAVTLTDATPLGPALAAVGAIVMAIEENEEGDLTVTAEDFPAANGGAAVYPSQAPAGYLHDYNASPGNADTPIIFETAIDPITTTLSLGVAVKGAGANWGGAQVHVSLDSTNYTMAGVVYGRSRAGALSAAAGAGASSIAVDGLGAEQLITVSANDAAAFVTLCYVGGSNPEYLAYQTATLTGAGAYTLSSLVHSAYGMPALAHADNDIFVRVDERVAQLHGLDASLVGKTVYVKVCSFNIFGRAQQSLADVSATTYTVTGLMMPYRDKAQTGDIAPNAATEFPSIATASSVSVTNQLHVPDNLSWRTALVSKNYTPAIDCEVDVICRGSASYTTSDGGGGDYTGDLQVGIYTGSGSGTLQSNTEWYQPNPGAAKSFIFSLFDRKRLTLTGGTSYTFTWAAAKWFSTDTVTITDIALELIVMKR